MPGVTGRQVNAAFVRAGTWGLSSPVTQKILLNTSAGLDDKPSYIDDPAFSQGFISTDELGDRGAITTNLSTTFRYETIDRWLAAACGSVAAPVVVSSQAAGSLVAYQHTITLAQTLTPFYTLAIDLVRYVLEIPTFKISGFTVKTDKDGTLTIDFPIHGSRAVYDSVVNTNSVIANANSAPIANRVFRAQGQFSMNLASGNTLAAGDIITPLADLEISATRPMADKDNVFGQDYIIEPEDDGFASFALKLTYPRMTTITANSIAIAMSYATLWKATLLFQGPYVNSTTRRSILFEWPALEPKTGGAYKGEVTGANQVRPTVELMAKRSQTVVNGMGTLTDPMRITIVNGNSANLLS